MKLSILIPSRAEMFLVKTIENILENIEADTEIIAVLDGEWSDPPVPRHERVNVIYVSESVGQREATNMAAKLARGKYVMKIDAHCAFDKGFDRKMIEFFAKHGDNITAVPVMRNLWAFDWKCMKCGSRWYQGSTPTRCMRQERGPVPNDCDGKEFQRRITWKVEAKRHESAAKNWKSKHSPHNKSYRFDSEPHFQYFPEYVKREGVVKDGYNETMSLQGSCWMMPREKYSEYIPFRERFGSWGSEGIEIACWTWLSGRKILCNHNTWYGHLFRTQGADFNFPYKQPQNKVRETKAKVWEEILNANMPGQIYPVSWLVEKFWPISGWDEESLKSLKEKEAKP